MAIGNRVRTHPGICALVALILVAVFGSPAYVHWAAKHAGNIFFSALAWPSWTFSTDQSIRSLVSDDLRAVLVVVLTYVFVSALAPAAAGGWKGAVGRILAGWGGFIFAGAFAGLIAALIKGASFTAAVTGGGGAEGGGRYGLLIGWIVGLISLVA